MVNLGIGDDMMQTHARAHLERERERERESEGEIKKYKYIILSETLITPTLF